MDEYIEFPTFKLADLPLDLRESAGIVSMAGIVDDVHVQLEVLRELTDDFMLHPGEDDRWCLHIPGVLEDGEALVHTNLCHVITAGVAFTIKHILDRRIEASLN